MDEGEYRKLQHQALCFIEQTLCELAVVAHLMRTGELDPEDEDNWTNFIGGLTELTAGLHATSLVGEGALPDEPTEAELKKAMDEATARLKSGKYPLQPRPLPLAGPGSGAIKEPTRLVCQAGTQFSQN